MPADDKSTSASSPERDKALGLVLNQIERNFGKGSIMRLGDASRMRIETTPTGALTLDLALGDDGKGTAGRQQFREGSGRQSDALDRIRQPAQLLQVQEQRSTGIADAGGMARSAAEVPQQPAVDGAKTEVIGG